MTQDEIIEMARQVGMIRRIDEFHSDFCDGVYEHELEAFAKLVAEHEREACAKICEDLELPFVADAIHARKNK